METDKIQERIDAIAKGMTDHGLRMPGASFYLNANCGPVVCLTWAKKESSLYGDGSAWFHGTAEVALATAEAHVAALPSPEEAKMSAFLSVLSEAIELGKKNDIGVEHVNPLMALMKKLSKNALQHKPQESA